MAVEFNSVEKKVLNDPSGATKHYAQAKTTGRITITHLTEEIGRTSTVNGADIRAVLYSLVELVPKHLSEGKIVELQGLGSFRVSISSKAEDSPEEVTAHSIKKGRVIFTAGKAFKDMLKLLSFKKQS